MDTTKDTVVDGSGEVTRTQILSWCLDNNFELVECDEVAEDDNGSDEEGGLIFAVVILLRILRVKTMGILYTSKKKLLGQGIINCVYKTLEPF